MPLGFEYNYQQSGTPGTLSSQGLYHRPNVPANSGAMGIQGTDGRAYTGNVQGNELVENRLSGLLNQSNPYIQNARRRGMETASRRGLGNSSISAGASERAAIESAMPIAQQDAQTYFQSRTNNQNALNQNLMQEREISNRMLEADRRLAFEGERSAEARANAAADRDLRLQMQRENLAYEGEQQGLSRQQQEMMARLGYDFDIGTQSNQARIQNWLQDNQFNRQLYGDFFSSMQNANLQNSSNFYGALMNGLMSNPEVFGNPEYLSGLNNFFHTEIFDNSFNRIISQMFNRGG